MIVTCIDDAIRPSDIPLEEWIQRGKKYTVLKVVNTIEKHTNRVIAKSFKLKEVGISNPKYAGYHIRRFAQVSFGEDATHSLEEQIEKEITIGELEYEEEVLTV